MNMIRLCKLVVACAAAGTLTSALAGASVVSSAPASAAGYRVPVLSYHDIVPVPSLDDEPESVSVDNLVRQFSALHAKGYTPVTMDQVEAASRGETALPAKSILLTFDDGYRSFHTHVLPLLKAYKWPATLAVIGTRVDSAQVAGEPAYMTTRELRDVVASGLVQLANHTDNLHHGVLVNKWGNAQPAAVNRIWANGRLETDAEWFSRVTSDLQRNQERLRTLTGKTPTALVWPYGRQNEALQKVARSLGLTMLFTLDDGISDLRQESAAVRRYLVGRDDREGAIVNVTQDEPHRSPTVRAVVLRVQDVAPSADGLSEKAFSAALSTLGGLQGNVAALDPFIREKGLVVGAAYANEVLPVSYLYANRVAVLSASKAGYDSWLSVSLSPWNYAGLTQEQVLALVEDAAKAIPLKGLFVEDADQVDPSVIAEAVRRVHQWRGETVLSLGFTRGVSDDTIAAAVSASSAKYVWLPDGVAPPLRMSGASVIQTFDAASVGKARAQAQAGFSHLAITGVPEQASLWTDFFSLRSMPQRRIEVKVK
jgi:poly-beta-1,6-N-acetyl-D-glucosamine N-deacetylase PgaB